MATLAQGFSGRSIARQSVGWSIAISVLLIVAGLAAIALPLIAGVFVTAIVAWILLFGGVAHLVLSFHVRGAGAHVWEALIGIAYLAMGIFMFVHPLGGLVAMTFLLAWYLLIKGIFELIAGFSLRGVSGGGWLFVDAVISIVIALLLWGHLPGASTWAVGTLVGVAILFAGISRLMLSLSARRVHAAYV